MTTFTISGCSVLRFAKVRKEVTMENKVMAIARTAVYIAQKDVPNLEKAHSVNMLIKVHHPG